MRHLPNLKKLETAEILDIMRRAEQIKSDPKKHRNLLSMQSMAMLFQKTSTRTRVSFEVAMKELGGHAIYIDWLTSNFVLSGIEYETEYLSRNVSSIMARMMHHDDLLKIISSSNVPVINGCDERFHPCQALTDLFTIGEIFQTNLKDARIVYVGVQNNVSNSLVIICDKLGVSLTLATPEIEDDDESLDEDVQKILAESASLNHTTDVRSAVKDGDFIYTDTWIDMQYFNNPSLASEKNAKIEKMIPFQVNKSLLQDVNCKIMHDMPIHEGYEITGEMVRDPRSIIFQQAENRLHAQKGLLWWLYEQAELI